MGGSCIERKNHVTFLGVVLDDKLKFNEHINLICKKVSKSVGVMYRLSNYVPFSILKQIYYTLIYPYITYCNIVWGGTYDSHLYPLNILQKRAVRIINNKTIMFPTNNLFFSNLILKLSDVHKLKLGVHMFRNQNMEIFKINHDYITRFRNNSNPSFQRLTITQRSLFYSGAITWNGIPHNIRSLENLNSFKKLYKSYLISTYT